MAIDLTHTQTCMCVAPIHPIPSHTHTHTHTYTHTRVYIKISTIENIQIQHQGTSKQLGRYHQKRVTQNQSMLLKMYHINKVRKHQSEQHLTRQSMVRVMVGAFSESIRPDGVTTVISVGI